MADHLTPAHYAQFRTIEQALLNASIARVVGADDALRELEVIKREMESGPALSRHWGGDLIESRAAFVGVTL